MHTESFEHMQRVVRDYFPKIEKGKVLEVGSMTKKPGYRPIFDDIGWEYSGCDLEAGPNVDFVLEDPFLFPMEEESYDAIISGQMLEHNAMFWLTFLEMSRVLKVGGVMAHIAPSRGREHRTPQDCWRFYRDGMTVMGDWAGLEVLSATTDWTTEDIEARAKNRPWIAKNMRNTTFNPDSKWGDTVGVFLKKSPTGNSPGVDYIRKFNKIFQG